MTKDILDEILEAHTKNSIMLKKLIEHGLNREELIKALFDQSGMTRVKAKVYHSHYTQSRKKYDDALRNLEALLTNPCMDWLCGHNWPSQLQAMKKRIEAKRNELYPKKLLPKGLIWGAVVNKKIVSLFNIIKPVVDLINKEAGRKRYSDKDIYKLIANFWNITYGVFEGCFTPEQIEKRYENNFKKYLKK